VEFRVVGPDDAEMLVDMFAHIDDSFFRPHSFAPAAARHIAQHRGRDAYLLLVDEGRAVAYGMLRGWDEGFATPSLGIAVRTDCQGRGLGRRMMEELHGLAADRGAEAVRLRVHLGNTRARRLYESMGYGYRGWERGELLMEIALGPREAGRVRAAGRPRAELLPVDDVRWTEFLATTQHDFHHLPGYVALCAARESGDPHALLVQGDRGAWLLPLVVRDAPSGARDAVSPYGYPGPLVGGEAGPAFAREAMTEGVRLLREVGIVSLFVRFHPLLDADPPEGIGTAVLQGETVSVDLSLPEDVLWRQTRENHRRNITRALAEGYVARMDTDWGSFDEFKRLYHMTMERNGASGFYRFDDAYFAGLREALGERLHLGVVEKDGVVVAASLLVETNGIVQYHLSGSDGSGARVQPTKLMLDFARRWAKARGNRYLHLGGGVGGRRDSLLSFKLGFSPLLRPYWTLRIVIDEPRYRRLVADRDPSLDPDVRDGYFPLYRVEDPATQPSDAE
jgi:ribosomal protein S18 acetylase RimI-like enzyme